MGFGVQTLLSGGARLTVRRARAAALTLAGIGALAGCASEPPPADGALLREWMDVHFALARGERISPPVASRVFAYAAVAYYEGLAAGDSDLRSLAGQLNGLDSLPRPGAGAHDWPIVAAVAQAETLRGLYAGGFVWTENAIDETLDRQIAAQRAAGTDSATIERSAAYGRVLATAVQEWIARDGLTRARTLAYDPEIGRQHWINTTTMAEYVSQSISPQTELVFADNPTASLRAGLASERTLLINRPKLPRTGAPLPVNPTQALEPYWGDLRPFVLRAGDECAAPPPAPYSEESGSAFDEEVEAVWRASRELTEAQRRTALFWADNPGQTGTPPGHWVSILRQVSAARNLDLHRTAELYALAAVGMADAFIGCWREKYRSRVVRPVTAVRRTRDPGWTTAVVTPPFPEYPSGHSVQSAAAAEILTSMLGEQPFTDSTHVAMGHEPRAYPTFRAAAEEAAISRLYGGIHYPMAITNGLEQGRCIGRAVIERVRTRSDS